jgi:hypothetical protein
VSLVRRLRRRHFVFSGEHVARCLICGLQPDLVTTILSSPMLSQPASDATHLQLALHHVGPLARTQRGDLVAAIPLRWFPRLQSHDTSTLAASTMLPVTTFHHVLAHVALPIASQSPVLFSLFNSAQVSQTNQRKRNKPEGRRRNYSHLIAARCTSLFDLAVSMC